MDEGRMNGGGEDRRRKDRNGRSVCFILAYDGVLAVHAYAVWSEWIIDRMCFVSPGVPRWLLWV